MNQGEIKKKVECKINQLIAEFNKYPEKFLTEEDVRCYLYHMLLGDFNTIHDCQDGTKSIPIHCEVRWYGHSGSLKYRSDIVILNVSSLITREIGGLKLPSKGYGFNKPLVIIELKLRRTRGESDKKFRSRIDNDRIKIQKIRKDLRTKFLSYILVFDKKRNINFITNENNNHKDYYIYPYV